MGHHLGVEWLKLKNLKMRSLRAHAVIFSYAAVCAHSFLAATV